MRQIVRANKLLQPPIPGPARNRPKVPNLGFQHLSGIGPDPEFWQSARIRELRETAYFLELPNSWEMPKNTKSWNSSNSVKTEKTGKSADFREIHKSRAIPDSGVPDPRIRLPRPGTPELPSRTQELPCLGGVPPRIGLEKGEIRCFLLFFAE